MLRSQPLRRSPLKRRAVYTGPSDETVAMLMVRCGGICEFPGCWQSAQDPHHRYERGSGGRGVKGPDWINNLSNLLAACRHHNYWCSNVAPFQAHTMGWRLNGSDLPWLIPVQTFHDPMPVWLCDDGTYTTWPPEDADAVLV